AQGIGFAIPISATLGMLHNIIENNNTGRAYIGVSYTTITPEVAKGNNLPVTHGAYIGGGRGSSSVVAGGPAAQAGVLDGDIITKINDVELGPAGSVATLVGEYKPGDTLKFTILRNGQEINLNITIAAYPTE
ncbi:PDZ domain-containing protein, partial [Candidatus Saccharibacteria bacterium]|nr:PDZ domain-containing protein [Candidatus Saccharibacteria bacterium]